MIKCTNMSEGNVIREIELLGTRHHHYSNFAGCFISQPQLYFEPCGILELRKILAAARVTKKTVKVVGVGHSLSDIACTNDYMVNLRHFNRVLEIDIEKHTVRAQGGILLSDLNKELDKHELAFSSLGTISYVTLGGAIAVGYHGSGKDFQILSAKVLGVELMLASGEVLTLGPEDGDRFYAACLNLGALGILLSATVQCEPAFLLHQVQCNGKLRDVLQNLLVHLGASEHFRFMWYSHTDDVIYYHASRTADKPIKAAPSGVRSWFWGTLIGVHLTQCLMWLSISFHRMVPHLSRFAFYLDKGRKEIVDHSVNVFNFACPFAIRATEWAIPVDKTAVVLQELKTWHETSGFPVHGAIEVRFMKGDDVPLSPAYGRDVCYVSTSSPRPFFKDADYRRYFDAFFDIMHNAGGRPHWAKEHSLTDKDFSKLYPKWTNFLKVREDLDPNGMFLNNYLRRIFSVQ